MEYLYWAVAGDIYSFNTEQRKHRSCDSRQVVSCQISDLTWNVSAEKTSDMDNTELNVEKLAAELAGNTVMDETSVNDQTYQQIVAFLKTDKMNMFR